MPNDNRDIAEQQASRVGALNMRSIQRERVPAWKVQSNYNIDSTIYIFLLSELLQHFVDFNKCLI